MRAIRKYIGQDSEVYAAQMIGRIIAQVEQTSRMPSRGHPVHEFPEESLREVHEPPYRIIYSYTEDELRVITLVHFRQKLPI